jgi:predicted phage terminase large subunit-like protein
VSPALRWDWAHTAYIREQLDRVTSGEITRMMLFVPPRHGKSELATIHYPAYRLEQDPTKRIVIAAYNATLAEKFSRRVRSIARKRLLSLDPERQAVNDWMMSAGGGCRAVGVGGGITGQGGDLIIIDDPVKSREEADSATYRDRVWHWYTDDLYTRLEPGAAIVLIMTRWHEDDLAGRILASDQASQWTAVNLPALALDDDPLDRAVGAALCPERYDEAALLDIQKTLGPRGWQALYQQKPAPPEGAMFKRHWFEIVKSVPTKGERVRYWDLAGAGEGNGDYTVGVLATKVEQHYFIENVVRVQLTAHHRNALILQTAATDQATYGNVKVWIEQAPGLAKEATDTLVRNLAAYGARADRVSSDKVTRADPLAAQCEAGNVSLLAGAWNTVFLDELTAFPYVDNDDQTDAASGAFNKLAGRIETTTATNPLYTVQAEPVYVPGKGIVQ